LGAMVTDKGGGPKVSKLVLWQRKIAESPIPITGVVLVVVFVIFAFVAPNFLTLYVLSNIVTFASSYGFVVVGVTFLMISGEFDLSVGSMLAVAGYVFAYSLLAGVPPLLAAVITLAAGALMGLINGLIVVRTGIPSFIATLGTLLAYRGIAHALGRGRALPYTPAVKPVLFDILNGYITPLNQLTDPPGNLRASIIWFVLVVLFMSYLLMRTRYGNWTFAVGGNSGAALSQAVNVRRVKLINFMMSGTLAALASIIIFAQRPSMNELLGDGLELTAVAAAVIGGVSLNGGVGTIVGASLGILLLNLIQQALVLMSVPNDVFQGLVGAIIILSVVANTYLGPKE
jgi:simple sugar transport system permease protein